MTPPTRRALAITIVLIYLVIYIALAAMAGEFVMARAPVWAGMLFYAVAGIIWVVPLRPLFGWMKRP